MLKPNKEFDQYIKNASFAQLEHLELLSNLSPYDNNTVTYLEDEDVASQFEFVRENFAFLDADQVAYFQELDHQKNQAFKYSLSGALGLGTFYFFLSKSFKTMKGSVLFRFFQSTLFAGIFFAGFNVAYKMRMREKIEFLYFSVQRKKYFN